MPLTMKETISSTYLSLINRKSIDKVTIKDLVEECGISRQTFYYHFKDIIEVIEWTIDRNCEKKLAESLKQSTAAAAIGVYVDMIIRNRESLRRGLMSSKRDYIQQALFRSLQNYLQELFRKTRPSIPISTVTEQLALQFCAGGMAGILLAYCQNESIPQKELSEQIASFLSAIEQRVQG